MLRLPCPQCSTQLTIASADAGLIAGCAHCGGIWMDNGASQVVAGARLAPDAWDFVSQIDAAAVAHGRVGGY